jgi:hypothetical protein
VQSLRHCLCLLPVQLVIAPLLVPAPRAVIAPLLVPAPNAVFVPICTYLYLLLVPTCGVSHSTIVQMFHPLDYTRSGYIASKKAGRVWRRRRRRGQSR